jgi:hypothetical protein
MQLLPVGGVDDFPGFAGGGIHPFAVNVHFDFFRQGSFLPYFVHGF